MDIKIDKDIPIPTQRKAMSGISAALRALKPGESFFVPEKHPSDFSSFVAQTKLRGKVACRKVTENDVVGTRVWRLEE